MLSSLVNLQSQYMFTHLYNLLQMVAILSNHEASLIYFSLLIMLISPSRLKATLYMKIKKNGGYLFLLQLLLPHTHPPNISHSAIYLKIATNKRMEKYVHTSLIVHQHVYSYKLEADGKSTFVKAFFHTINSLTHTEM